MRPPTRPILVALLAGLVSAFPSPGGADQSRTAFQPDSTTRYYTMTVRVRPFLFWMTREDVGGARMSWNEWTASERHLELLIGSDPERAPMGINRWGFILEQTTGDTTRLTGVMTETDDRSIDAARTNAGALGPSQGFRSIRSVVRDQEAASSVSRMVLGKDVSYRDYDSVLDRVPAGGGQGEKRSRLAPGTDPGFLTAVKALLHSSVERWQSNGGTEPARRSYVYFGRIYELRLRSATFVNDAVVNGHAYGPALDGKFEIRNASGLVASFRMVYGLTGAEAEAPLRVVYRPRWWVEIELLRANPRLSKNSFAMRAGPSTSSR